MSTIRQDFAAPLPVDELEWRVGTKTKDGKKGLALVYFTSRSGMERLDDVVGPENWRDEYDTMGTTTLCHLSVRIDGEWITKVDGCGAPDIEAEKGAISDAFKRACVKWGIGRYLYRVPSPWVELDDHGRIKTPPKLPAWALPPSTKAPARAASKTNGGTSTTSGATNGDAMSPQEATAYQAALVKLRNEFFDIHDDVLALQPFTGDQLQQCTSKSEGRRMYGTLKAALEAAMEPDPADGAA